MLQDKCHTAYLSKLLVVVVGAGADTSIHTACREVLLLLRDYLRYSRRPTLVDTACSVVGRALAQQEHMLRSNRVALWSWPAVLHLDALVQLYAEMVVQVIGIIIPDEYCLSAAY
jgi:hypothetical protein